MKSCLIHWLDCLWLWHPHDSLIKSHGTCIRILFSLCCIKLIVFHFLSLLIIHSCIFCCNIGFFNFFLSFHLLFLCHSFFRSQSLKHFIFLWNLRHLRWNRHRNRFQNWDLHNNCGVIFDIETFTSSDGDAATVDKFNHFLSYDRHLKNLSDRGPFLSIFIKHSTY